MAKRRSSSLHYHIGDKNNFANSIHHKSDNKCKLLLYFLLYDSHLRLCFSDGNKTCSHEMCSNFGSRNRGDSNKESSCRHISRSQVSNHNSGENFSPRSNNSNPRIVRVPHGLPNIGNNCYMNSVLQCLNNIQWLNDFFSKTIFTNSSILSLYAELLKAMSSEYNLRETLNRLKCCVSSYSSNFDGYGQADAREFLNVLLNAFYDELTKCYSSFPINFWFTINIDSQIICKICGLTSSSTEPMNFLPLRLNGQYRDETRLENLLSMFNQEKTINGRLQCSRCHRNSEHCERKTIGSPLPSVIIIHFTRFSPRRTKDDTAVTFPLIHNFSDKYPYELIGVITHIGSIYGGHFIAYTKYHQNEWYCCNDCTVYRISELDLMKLARDAYILFYARQR